MMHSSGPMVIEKNVPLRNKNWFNTGGAARFYCAPTTPDSFGEALSWASGAGVGLHVLGLGANTLVSDDGFDGLIIQPHLVDVSCAAFGNDSWCVRAGAGVTMADLIALCLDHHALGLEDFGGIPGSVGGSVYNNLHYFERSLADFLKSAVIIDRATGVWRDVDASWLELGYDHSKLHEKNFFLVSATFALARGTEKDVAYARGRHAEIVRHRSKRYPTSRTCGCFFRNFHPHEVENVSGGKKLVYAAYYLDNVGVKGDLQRGKAGVSYQHANMIVAQDGATSADIIAVARVMQERVYERFGIVLQPECELVGFASFPLFRAADMKGT